MKFKKFKKRKFSSGNFFTDATRLMGWMWKKRPQGKGKGFLHRLWESMNR